ncbi:MAG: cache domain-containing protein [Sulfurovum sp.]|nr:cache domain-containing protein [Sulfurovum sp.]
MKKYFQKISLSAINLYGVAILFLFAILFTFLVIFEEYRDFEQEEVLLRQNYLTAQKKHIQDEAQRVLTYIRYEYDRSKDQNQMILREKIISSIEHLFSKKNSSNYVFIYSLEGENISDPNKPKNLNEKITQLGDANGFNVLDKLIKQAKEGGGYVEYLWDNPVTKKLSQKISYVTIFEPWGWLVGTGVYLDEIEGLLV